MVRSKACWAKAVSLSKVMDLRSAGSIRANTASMTEMVSAAVFPASRVASVAGFALMKNEHWPCALTNDEVTLPVAALGSGVDPDGDLAQMPILLTAGY
jgi:hypothetical protein